MTSYLESVVVTCLGERTTDVAVFFWGFFTSLLRFSKIKSAARGSRMFRVFSISYITLCLSRTLRLGQSGPKIILGKVNRTCNRRVRRKIKMKQRRLMTWSKQLVNGSVELTDVAVNVMNTTNLSVRWFCYIIILISYQNHWSNSQSSMSLSSLQFRFDIIRLKKLIDCMSLLSIKRYNLVTIS